VTVRLRPRARADIDAIWEYTADRWDPEQANAYVLQIGHAIERLAVDAFSSSDASHLYPALRKARAGAHLIYFLPGENVDVVRILHERQDAAAKLDDQ
jgi:toxin ParE1/3/4